MPWCTYTSPEVARVGLTRREAEETSRGIDVWRVEWAQVDRARTDAALEGFVEVLTEKGSDRIVGATIVGKDAGEQIATAPRAHGRRSRARGDRPHDSSVPDAFGIRAQARGRV
jgi:pyruvate/2-oxoglutarate dehydrogenase complex dihydrolipoamide dehydrogenase (E3) component